MEWAIVALVAILVLAPSEDGNIDIAVCVGRCELTVKEGDENDKKK